jgi:hypothetical protein
MRREAVLLVVVGVVLLLLPAGGASAAGAKKCPSPKGMRAPAHDLKAGGATSCGTARKVAVSWDRRCEPQTALCSARAGGKQWPCRASINTNAGTLIPNVYVRCALEETTKGRPSVTFHQDGVIHSCARPQGTAAAIRFLTGYYDARCGTATKVAQAWDSACDPGEDGSTCSFDSGAERWSCRQVGDPKEAPVFNDYCSGTRTGKGRVAVTFAVGEVPPPPGVPDSG